MKILITTDMYSPAINGVVTSVLNLQRELLREGHQVMILTLSGTCKTYQEDNIIYIGSVKMDVIYPTVRVRLLFPDRWMKKLLDWKPDVVHSQCEFNTFGLAKRISKKLDIPLIHTYHTIYEDYTHYFSPGKKLGRKVARMFTRQVCQKADHIIAPTEKTAELLRQYQINTDITVVPSGLVMDKFSQSRKWNSSVSQLVLIYVGRLAKEKNLDEIIQYLESWKGGRITFIIVGDGPYCNVLKEEAKLLPEAVTVHFVGMASSNDVPYWYALGDLFVSASQSETQGLTYIEAAAAGLPLLCREDECLRSVIHQGVNGWRYLDKDDFLSKLEIFLEADPTQRSQMGISSRRIAGQFDICLTVPQIVAVYKTAILRRKAKAGVAW